MAKKKRTNFKKMTPAEAMHEIKSSTGMPKRRFDRLWAISKGRGWR